MRSTDRPSLLCCKTIIGKGAPTKAGTEHAHGAALGEKEVAATRAALGWTHPPFEIPQAIYARWNARECGALLESSWNAKFAAYRAAYPGARGRVLAAHRGRSAADVRRDGVARSSRAQAAKGETVATRKASQQAIEAFAAAAAGNDRRLRGSHRLGVHQLVGQQGRGARGTPGNYVNFGVREFAMSAIANGLALHGGFIPYVGTFLTFSDYARNALRMAALMKLRSIFVTRTIRSASARTARRTNRSSTRRACASSPAWTSGGRATRSSRRSPGRRRIERRHGPSCLLFTRQNCAFVQRDAARRRRHRARRLRARRFRRVVDAARAP